MLWVYLSSPSSIPACDSVSCCNALPCVQEGQGGCEASTLNPRP